MRGFSCAIAAAAVSVGAFSTHTSAAIIVNDNFDGYANQAAFEVAWPGISTAGAALLDNTRSVSAPQSALIEATGTAASRRSRHTFAETSTIGTLADPGYKLTWSFDFYDSITGNPQRNYANLQDGTAPNASNQLISMGLNNNQLATANGGNYYMARILGHTPEDTGAAAGSYFKLNDFVDSPLRTVGWHNLKVEITSDDGLSSDFAFYVDGVLAETVSDFSTAATFRSYDNIALGSGVSNGSASASFDNMFLEVVVPEPTALALLGLGAAGLLSRRRRA